MTNRDKLEQLRRVIIDEPDGAISIGVLRQMLAALIGVLLGSEGPQLPVAEERTLRPGDAPLLPGDVVRLRSGGPAMTVLGLVEKGSDADMPVGWVRCGIMTSGDPAGHYTGYPVAALIRIEDERRSAAARTAEREMLTRVFEALEEAERAAHGSPQALQPTALREMLLKAKSELGEHLYGQIRRLAHESHREHS